MQQIKGCVYFFRHIGLEPVKIGYSTSESPLDRFNQFKTYAPYGSEILGFIICDEPYLIEQKLHLKYSGQRLNGEWFNISEENVNKEINFYSNIEDINDRNNFQIAWAKELLNRKRKANKLNPSVYNNLLESLNSNFTTNEVKNYLKINGVSERTANRWIRENTAVNFIKVSHGNYQKL